MDHVAIMKKSWRLTKKILKGKKTIETRQYKIKHIPWGKIKIGDNIYFKNSGELITVKAKVLKVSQFVNLYPDWIYKLLIQYGERIGIEDKDIPKYFEMFKEKKYLILIFLKEVEVIKEPFGIKKDGFGNMASWITVSDINDIKK